MRKLVNIIAEHFSIRKRSTPKQEEAEEAEDQEEHEDPIDDENQETEDGEEADDVDSSSSCGELELEDQLAKALGGTPRPSSPVKQTPEKAVASVEPGPSPKTADEVEIRLRELEHFGFSKYG